MKKTVKQVIVLVLSAIILIGLCIWAGKYSTDTGKDSSHAFAVYFTEVLASNSMYPDENGNFYDFVEIYNSADGEIDISDFKLTDNDKSIKYQFPDGTILAPGEYLVVWCETGAGDRFADFSISRNGGETIYLMNRKNVIVDTVTTVPSEPNCPMILSGSSSWTLVNYATPGFPNTAEGYQSYLHAGSAEDYPVKISEVLSSNSAYPAPDGLLYDFIELYNPTDADVDISGCKISDNVEDLKRCTIPDGTVVPANGYLVLWCSETYGIDFGISSSGDESVYLSTPAGNRIDSVDVPAAECDISYSLQEDGTWAATAAVTPGEANALPSSAEAAEDTSELTVSISEVMSDNASTLNVNGAFPDWIELYNYGETAVSLQGCSLTDNEANLNKWSFPGTVIQPGAYLIILCDGNTGADDGYLHASFSLAASGESVTLSRSGTVIDHVDLGDVGSDVSIISYMSSPTETKMATPGFENTKDGWLAFQDSLTAPRELVISEVMTANGEYLRQSDGKYYDWIEFYNNSDSEIRLSDYSVSDDKDMPDKMALPDIVLVPGEYYCVTLKDASFGLNVSDDYLYLFDRDGKCTDCMHLTGIPYRSSYGRILNEGGFWYFSKPTPSYANTDGSRAISDKPTVSVAPGIYDGIESLTVSLSGEGNIYYTTDGSWPTVYSTLYESPLVLSSTTVLRAICVQDGCLPGDTASFSYIINENHIFPVVSISIDAYDFNDIHEYPYNNWIRHANICYYDPDGGSFDMDCGMKVFGSVSRDAEKQSFKVIFRGQYGDSELNYPLYDGYDVTTFTSLVLRAGQDCHFSFIREELMESLAREGDSSLVVQQSKYVVLYINGSYYGLYNLKEELSADMYAIANSVPSENVQMCRITLMDQYPDLMDLMDFAEDNDMSVDENYEYLCEHLDIDSLIEWMIFETYCGNTDIKHNVRYVMSPDVDGKWHLCYYDLDWSFRSHNTLKCFETGYPYTIFSRAVSVNKDFRERFLKRLSELLTTVLTDEHVLSRVDELVDAVTPEMARDWERWGHNLDWWYYYLGFVRDYVEVGRAKEMAQGYAEYWGISDEEFEELFGDVQ